MKKIYVTMLGLALFIMTSVTSTFAANGSSVIPMYRYFMDTNGVRIFVGYLFSNITASPIHINLKFYKNPAVNETGPVILVESGEINNPGNGIFYAADVLNYSEGTPGVSASFDIAPYTAAQFGIMPPSVTTGGYNSGVVEWTQDSNVSVGLVAEGTLALITPTSSSYSAVQINGGKAF